MSAIDHGGAAFPWCGDLNDCPTIGLGMTLRDYFAGKALAALIGFDGKDYNKRGDKGVPIMAKYAYEYADAMLAERAK